LPYASFIHPFAPSSIHPTAPTSLAPEEARMKTLIVVSTLALSLLGMRTAPAGAQATGPFCLRIVEFEEVAQFFLLPTAGGQVIMTGENISFGDAYSGAGYVNGSNFVFSVMSGLMPGLLEGVINTGTGQGFGTATFSDTGLIQNVTYAAFSPPCAP